MRLSGSDCNAMMCFKENSLQTSVVDLSTVAGKLAPAITHLGTWIVRSNLDLAPIKPKA